MGAYVERKDQCSDVNFDIEMNITRSIVNEIKNNATAKFWRLISAKCKLIDKL